MPEIGAGFTMVEVTAAMGIAAFCLVALLGLLPRGLGALEQSHNEVEAGNIAREVADDWKAAVRVGARRSVKFGFAMPEHGGEGVTQLLYLDAEGNGQVGAGRAGDSVYRVEVRPEYMSRGHRGLRIVVNWPAAAERNLTARNAFAGSFETWMQFGE